MVLVFFDWFCWREEEFGKNVRRIVDVVYVCGEYIFVWI